MTVNVHTSNVSLEVLANGLALLSLGNAEEKLVTLTMQRMDGLAAALEEARKAKPAGLIITGPAPEMFTAGADLNLIRDVTDPQLAEQLARKGQEIFGQIEKLPCMTVAAISGPCVGGGCEMVLACRHRIITDHPASVIGLPEIKLGILPGFGGTQRLPRLVGLPRALDIILAGKTLRPKQALSAGLVDEICSVHKLRERAEAIASGKSRLRSRRLKLLDRVFTHTGLGRSFVKRKAAQSIAKETKGLYPAPPSALAAAVLGLEQGMEIGLKFEARELGRLIVTPESKALVRIFFLTEASKAIGKSAKKAVEQLQTVVIGAGIMGAGIAGALAKSECQVVLKDTSEEALARGLNHIKSYLAKLKYLSETERSFILNRIETTTQDSPKIGSADFAIEAIFEDLQIKQKVLAELGRVLPQHTIIATNTSSLSVSEIAQGLPNPERVIGMHFFNPVEKMPLVEIIRGENTGDKAVAVVAALVTKLGKFPIVVANVPGFLVNRILAPYLTEAAYLLADGYSISAIDDAALKFGMPMGPLRLLDEVGLDVASHVSEVMVKGYGKRMQGPQFTKILESKGRKGRKSGGGFYDFNEREFSPCPDIRAILGIEKPEVRESGGSEIADRMILQLVNEAVRCLDEGVAGAPGPEAASQIDLGSVMGMGFPPFHGGILSYSEKRGLKEIAGRLEELEKNFGARFAPARGITIRAKTGGRLT
ncbi:MAG: fatty acid oxidation complex subunit alpha FadJ [Proteobacteria bacterium]|nr:MAG: fatty acid oxidation complex subunit alpha FadJ [Pseudomonadota bacterium]